VHGVDPENLRIAIGWGFVAAVLMWLVLRWAFPDAMESRTKSKADDEHRPTTWAGD